MKLLFSLKFAYGHVTRIKKGPDLNHEPILEIGFWCLTHEVIYFTFIEKVMTRITLSFYSNHKEIDSNNKVFDSNYRRDFHFSFVH